MSRNGIQTHKHLVRKQTLSRLAKLLFRIPFLAFAQSDCYPIGRFSLLEMMK